MPDNESCLIVSQDLSEISKKIVGEVTISQKDFNFFQEEIKNIADLKNEIEKRIDKSATEILKIILGGAIVLLSSDIHLEPEEKKARIRIRIDGLLQDVTTINHQTYQSLLSRIKLLSGLKLNITDRPQDGRFSVLMHSNSPTSSALFAKRTESGIRMRPSELEEKLTIEIRASSLPAEHGESIVLRILNPKSLVDLESLGLRGDLLDIFKKEIKKPNGMIIVTGPTGSGKTTTLYAFLKYINKPEVKIITIEDPIEYHIEGISQTQVNPPKGYDFASGLQSIVRQDPDVILVGEIRDAKTCQIALQSALTGHLVFTTLHTNDAAGTIARLISLEGELANIGPAINLAIAQRLVRKACKKCSQIKKPSSELLESLRKELKNIPDKIKIPKIDQELKLFQAKGCQNCNFTGFQGRVGVFEAILIDDQMEKFILKNPSIAALREEAVKRGMISLRQDGLIKVINGLTTIEEVERVTGEG